MNSGDETTNAEWPLFGPLPLQLTQAGIEAAASWDLLDEITYRLAFQNGDTDDSAS
jgi:hypothetical protein